MLMRGASHGAPAVRQAIRSAVESSSLSKQDIAARAGVSRRTLYEVLEGTADPRLSTLESLAHVVGLDLFVAPKAVNAMQLPSQASDQLSQHSRVRRLLEHNMRSKAGSSAR